MAEASSVALAPGVWRSSMKTSLIRLLIMFAPIGTYALDQRTTPEVVSISKASNMVCYVIKTFTRGADINYAATWLAENLRTETRQSPVEFVAAFAFSTLYSLTSSWPAKPRPRNWSHLEHATWRISQSTASTLSTSPPPRTSACIDSTATTISSTSRAALCKWLWLRCATRPTGGKLYAASIWWVHERSDGADGLSSWQDCSERWTRVCGTKCQ